jgi:hypothetical protein
MQRTQPRAKSGASALGARVSPQSGERLQRQDDDALGDFPGQFDGIVHVHAGLVRLQRVESVTQRAKRGIPADTAGQTMTQYLPIAALPANGLMQRQA